MCGEQGLIRFLEELKPISIMNWARLKKGAKGQPEDRGIEYRKTEGGKKICKCFTGEYIWSYFCAASIEKMDKKKRRWKRRQWKKSVSGVNICIDIHRQRSRAELTEYNDSSVKWKEKAENKTICTQIYLIISRMAQQMTSAATRFFAVSN